METISSTGPLICVPTEDGLVHAYLPNGMVAELQINLKSVLEAKNVGHKPYEIERAIKLAHTPEGGKKPTDQHTWPDDDQARYTAAQDAQRKVVPDWLKDQNWVRTASAQGVPMGGDLANPQSLNRYTYVVMPLTRERG